MATTTTANTAAGAATINVVSTAGFAPSGQLLLNGTPVTYRGITATSFTGSIGTPASVQPVAISTSYRTPVNTPLHGGFLKIEKQDVNGVWTDVTLEILNLGTAGRNQFVNGCAAPNANSIIRIQHLRDVPSTAPGNACGNGSQVSTDYWPNVLYDAREGNLRDDVPVNTQTVFLGGVMHYIELDVLNLTRWFQGAIGVTGANAMNVTGYVVYFSDRRNNRNALGQETGEYGFEDFVIPNSAAGTPNGAVDGGEDVNGSGTLDVYGQTPVVPAGGTAPLNGAARPWTTVAANIAQVNSPLFFRRALKVVNGSLGNIILPGLSIVAENSVYLQGDYNANNAGFGNPHAATAVMADAVTLLSNAWNDRNSFINPHDPASRLAVDTSYRVAIIAGKGRSFARPTAFAAPQDFGTDGGAHNFLRYLENWGGRTLNYRGAIASFFFNRQAVGVYKCCTNVYSPPTRGYNFDVDFLQPSLLPPRTPVFRDLNTLGFTQITAPGR